MEIDTTSMTAQAIEAAEPKGATLQITLEDGSTDTVQVNPRWAALLAKEIRQGNSGIITLHGCLLPDSPEAQPFNRHALINDGNLSPGRWSGWLKNKPAQEAA